MLSKYRILPDSFLPLCTISTSGEGIAAHNLLLVPRTSFLLPTSRSTHQFGQHFLRDLLFLAELTPRLPSRILDSRSI